MNKNKQDQNKNFCTAKHSRIGMQYCMYCSRVTACLTCERIIRFACGGSVLCLPQSSSFWSSSSEPFGSVHKSANAFCVLCGARGDITKRLVEK